MDDVSQMLVTSLFKHAHRILDIANLQVMVFVENWDGDRFWSGNGKLRNEFVTTGKLSNRSTGIFEVEVGVVRVSLSVCLTLQNRL